MKHPARQVALLLLCGPPSQLINWHTTLVDLKENPPE
jgi:hypothetical protein